MNGKLTPIGELAVQCGLMYSYGGFIGISVDLDNPQDALNKLAEFRKMILQDVAKNIKPFGYLCLVDEEEIFYGDIAEAYGNGKNAEVTPLHDLSQF